jgi:hypothetical protein
MFALMSACKKVSYRISPICDHRNCTEVFQTALPRQLTLCLVWLTGESQKRNIQILELEFGLAAYSATTHVVLKNPFLVRFWYMKTTSQVKSRRPGGERSDPTVMFSAPDCGQGQ